MGMGRDNLFGGDENGPDGWLLPAGLHPEILTPARCESEIRPARDASATGPAQVSFFYLYLYLFFFTVFFF
jgi:hypothetical protein